MRVAAGCYGVAREGLINKEFAAELVQKYRPILLTSPKGLKCILKNRQLDILKVIVELNLRLTHNIEGFR